MKYYSPKVRSRLVAAIYNVYTQNGMYPHPEWKKTIFNWAQYIHPEGRRISGVLTPYQKQCKHELEGFLGLRCNRVRRSCN